MHSQTLDTKSMIFIYNEGTIALYQTTIGVLNRFDLAIYKGESQNEWLADTPKTNRHVIFSTVLSFPSIFFSKK